MFKDETGVVINNQVPQGETQLDSEHLASLLAPKPKDEDEAAKH